MNRRAITIALIVSLVISLVVWKKIKAPPPPVAQVPVVMAEPPKPAVKVVAARKRIPARTRLETAHLDEYMELREIVASEPPLGAFLNVASLANRFTNSGMFPGDIVVEDRLMGSSAVPALSFAIRSGYRAYTFAVSAVTGVAGFIQQGDCVDVIAKLQLPTSEMISKIVLENIKILAIGKTYEFDSVVPTSTPAIAAGKVDLVTVEVTPEQLERLNLLETSGYDFKLILKNLDDKNLVTTKGATPKMLLTSLGLAEEDKPKAPTVVPSSTAEISPFQPPPPPTPTPTPQKVEKVADETSVSDQVEEETPTVEVYNGPKKTDMEKDNTLKFLNQKKNPSKSHSKPALQTHETETSQLTQQKGE
ncbi:MAG: Flp pilus assembly protein CpaB [Candidatus Riflebacteria bacterium]|nr:Flp pilus assembly protein CpaB [Candidatus Riflebacteria bacterium]